jgi:hypothetical protein
MSNINPNNIDGTYPIAGQDNDSQGFRDNFTNLKNNLTFAKSEIEDLAAKVVLKSALTGTTLANEFSDSLMSGAKIRDFSETRYDLATASGTVTLNHVNGHYQTVTTSGSITIAFSNLPPTAALGRIRLEVEVASVAHTMTLPAAVTVGVDSLTGVVSNVVTFPATGKYIYEFTTEDAGTTVAVAELVKPFTTVPNSDVLTTNATTTSASLGDTGLSFVAQPNARYKFEAIIPFSHSASSTNTHTFSVAFSAGTCYALIEQQAGPTSVFELATISTTDATTSAVTTSSTSAKMCKITGTFTHTSAVTVSMRFATSGGTLTALAGANLTATRLA